MSEVTLSLKERVAAVRANTISATSRRSYRATWSRFLAWMLEHKDHLVTSAFGARVRDQEARSIETRKAILVSIASRSTPPIVFAQLAADDFVEWLLTLETRGGGSPEFSSFNNHRAALFNLFREYRHVMSSELQAELTTCFRGLKRSVAQQTSRGDVPVKVSKDPLSFELYEFMCSSLLKAEAKEAEFARAFLVISWNLRCRSSNTVSIGTSHMEWREDVLCVYFVHMKNDQTGARPCDPRHVYANPLTPSVCSILALGMYWSVCSVDSDRLFPGASQYDRFRKQLQALLHIPGVETELKPRGIDPQDVGTHSISKGSATYCPSGSTACPSATAVHLRAGWSLGGVQNTYLRCQGAGDMHVGRTIAGLPSNSELFATLPPRFTTGDDVVRAGVQVAFGVVTPDLQFVCEYALASLVYHHDYLVANANLSLSHPLFSCPLYQDKHLLQRLRDRVCVRLATEDHTQTASGMPPDCAMIAKIKALEDAVRRLDSTVVDRVIAAVEEYGPLRGELNARLIRETIATSLEAYGLPTVMERLTRQTEQPVNDENGDDGSTTFLYDWRGRVRRLPQDFKFPDGTPRQMWILWTCGSSSARLPALRHVQRSDLCTLNARKRLSDLRYLMCKLESAASRELG